MGLDIVIRADERSLGTLDSKCLLCLEKGLRRFPKREVIRLYEETGSISCVAKTMSCSRNTVRKILRRYKEGGEKGIRDRSRRPKRSPDKTALHMRASSSQRRRRLDTDGTG